MLNTQRDRPLLFSTDVQKPTKIFFTANGLKINAIQFKKEDILRNKIRPGIFANYQQSYHFWNSYSNPLEPLLEIFYGHYLKANNQPDGMMSYNYVVALLVNYFDPSRPLP